MDVLYSTGNTVNNIVITFYGVYCIKILNHYVVYPKLMYCKSTILQLKNREGKKGTKQANCMIKIIQMAI